MSHRAQPRLLHANIPMIVVTLVIVGGAATFVAASLRRPDVEAYPPTKPMPIDVGGDLIGPANYTVDATAPFWTYFDFSSASVVEDPSDTGWDLAFQRPYIIANGGPGFAGSGGIVRLDVAFDSLDAAPEGGYTQNRVRGDTVNEAVEDWYDYSWLSHVLRPKPATYAVKTADGRYAKIALVSYYCPGARSGCVTFRYVYQGDGTTRLLEARSPVGEALDPPAPAPEEGR